MSSNRISSTVMSSLDILLPRRPPRTEEHGVGLGRAPGYARDLMATGAETTRSPRARGLEFLIHLPNLVRLYWRLVRDARVSIWPKALLVGAGAYVALPFDL